MTTETDDASETARDFSSTSSKRAVAARHGQDELPGSAGVTRPAHGAIDGHLAAWVALAVLGLGAAAAFTVILMNHVVPSFDQPLLEAARAWAAYTPVWQVISESANIPLIVIGVGLVGWLFFTKRRREALIVALVLIAVTAGSEGVKQLVARPRPSGTDPNIPGVVYSYPSGHVLEALTIFGIIAIRLFRSHAPGVLAVLFAIAVVIDVIAVGFARVALNAHYPSDALASILAGAGVLGIYGALTHNRADRDVADSRG